MSKRGKKTQWEKGLVDGMFELVCFIFSLLFACWIDSKNEGGLLWKKRESRVG